MQLLKDIIATLVVQFAIFYGIFYGITRPAMDWLHAHGLGAHTPSSGPLHEEYEHVAGMCALVITGFPFLLVLALTVWFFERKKLSWWNPNRSWNQPKYETPRVGHREYPGPPPRSMTP